MTDGAIEAIQTVVLRVSNYAPLHQANVAAHVGFGLTALALGFAQFFTRKGGPTHRLIGRLFLVAFAVVILSAATGSVLFQFRAFLVVITMLAAYNALSGLRALGLRRAGLQPFDIALSLFGLTAVVVFVLAVPSALFPWDKTVIYGTLGALTLVAGYDLLRLAFPRRAFEATWIYEHIYKMTSAFAALASSAMATVFPEWRPASQLGPSALAILIILFFWARAARGAAQR